VPVHLVPIKTVSNFRDLGGYANNEGRVTRSGILYRSGEFSRLSRHEQSLLNGLGISKIVDFRSAEERQRSPSRWHDEATRPDVLLLSIGDSAADWSSALSQQLQQGGFTEAELNNTFIDMYANVPLENSTEYAALFAAILANDGAPLLFHCTAGKDRTGIAAALILSALNVPRETIMQDYMATNATVDIERMAAMLARIFSRQSGVEISEQSIRPMLMVEPIYLETTFIAIESEFGSVDNYLRQALGLSDADRAELQQLLLN
jgi:protein-tyrosine phosphatase